MPASCGNVSYMSPSVLTVSEASETLGLETRIDSLRMSHVVDVWISLVEYHPILSFPRVKFWLIVPTNHQEVLVVWREGHIMNLQVVVSSVRISKAVQLSSLPLTW